ncbi:MAG: twin-arginine translocation signal domain-containing protein [Afipia sp.]|nr:twin-arginine translocation signal domain-containing protein [Afipia sp.]
MERREFLKAAFGVAIGTAAFAAAAKAAPLAPQNLIDDAPHPKEGAQPALADQHDLDAAHVEDVRWGRRRHWGYRRRRFWGYRRSWHRRRFWGVRRRYWRRRYWRRRYW